ncbi:MAG TPA: 2-dehydro-3-deoxygalactonokinase [Burkholderiaceae bacterium]|jgi:2-dehydro-3-deoxygalactonokinase
MNWIGLDWGTSSLRGARFDEHGKVLEERAFARGILTVAKGGFGAVFDECFGDWMAPIGTRCLIGGMAGSQQGWVEAPYLACPATLDDIAGKLAWVEPRRIAIVPGMSCEHDGAPDVMRGEEVQVFGALQLLGIDHGLFVLPGTHSKWVRVAGGRIEGFETLMTGEFYALLRKHSILARTLPAEDGEPVESAFDLGVAQALRSPGLLQSAFSLRTMSLFERLALAERPSYLSGLVIGEEMRSRNLVEGESVIVIGDPALTRRYERVLQPRGMRVRSVGAAASWSGLWSIARRIAA